MNNVIGYCIFICTIATLSCAMSHGNVKSSNYYRSTTGSQLLMIHDSTWLVLHSGVGTLCDRFKLAWRDENGGEVTKVDSLYSIFFNNSQVRFNFEPDSLLKLEELTFLPQHPPKWDSITIETFYSNRKLQDTTLVNDHNPYLDMLSISLSVPEFNFPDTTLIEDQSRKIYTVYHRGSISASKTGAWGFFCLGY